MVLSLAFSGKDYADMVPIVNRIDVPRASSDAEATWRFTPDEIPGFEKTTLNLPAEDDGPLAATLVRAVSDESDTRPAVLYMHGFADYFFQAHLARAFEDAGYRFYALDLRRYGRSLRDGNRLYQARELSDYFAEIDWAVKLIRTTHPNLRAIVAHSTGGLIASLYLRAQKGKNVTERLVLCSPFLSFNFSKFNLALLWLVVRVARVAPHFVLPQKLNPVYGTTIHASLGGEWNYDLAKKPLSEFPLYAGWFRMIQEGHDEVARGLGVGVPILVLHSSHSRIPGREPVEADRRTDIVLDVKHMKELGPRLGKDVTLFEVPGGIHDLTLSQKSARNLAINEMVRFTREGP